ncbi:MULTISPECIES: Tab2/Atab2 family RNA-binding protein [unclassified Cyanobium]|uniref:Tab2/Atab2 family RNA-binding protein n=1 Tax=unclassified Cyanobium TaxID=2627006 RepID=UPI0020CFB7E3|nr:MULTISPECIES: Tab2/Atab2 family RNA-binding protein [unclassified Cyanobium]MCP9778262.1 Tab2/Atab2 family RNA-binding protein [Cyanobium sp. Tous-M-B4]MCP9877791.1 Tab2/Atab2 family RNA-binding protein [Cyanobium sp. A2C-AMD]
MKQAAPDWELDYYSRPILEEDGKKRWELLICSTPEVPGPGDVASESFRWAQACPATSVNSIWLREALEAALAAAASQGFGPPRRLRCWRASMRTMVQRAAEGLGLELVPSRRTYALVSWLQERERLVYPQEPGYMAGPLAPPPKALRSIAVPLPEAARGDSWAWATLPLGVLAAASEWELGFAGLVPLPEGVSAELPVPGIRLFSSTRALALAGWLAGLEPVRLEISGLQLVLEAGLEDRWLLTNLPAEEAEVATAAFAAAREQAGGLQFLAVQASEQDQRFEGFWLLRDLPDA